MDSRCRSQAEALTGDGGTPGADSQAPAIRLVRPHRSRVEPGPGAIDADPVAQIAVRAVDQFRAMSFKSLERRSLLPFAIFAGVYFAASIVVNLRSPAYGFDFRGVVWQPARDVLAGRSPYPPLDMPTVPIPSNAYGYPPLLAILATPLAMLPAQVALLVWDALSTAAMIGALRLVGLRDRRCFIFALASLPMASMLILGQPSAFLALGYAVVWRYRDYPYKSGIALGSLIALKFLAWPLLIWLAVSRRRHAATVGAVTTAALILGSWAVIGFQGLRDYARLLTTLSDGYGPRTHSIVAVATNAGASSAQAHMVAAVVAALLIAASIWLSAARRSDVGAFGAATAAGIFLSPIVHPHYLLALLIPLAVARPRAGWMWVLLLGLWISPTEPPAASWRLYAFVALALTLVLAMVVAAYRDSRGAIAARSPVGDKSPRLQSSVVRGSA